MFSTPLDGGLTSVHDNYLQRIYNKVQDLQVSSTSSKRWSNTIWPLLFLCIYVNNNINKKHKGAGLTSVNYKFEEMKQYNVTIVIFVYLCK